MKAEGLRKAAIVLLSIEIVLTFSLTTVLIFEGRDIAQAFSQENVSEFLGWQWIVALYCSSIPLLLFHAFPLLWMIIRKLPSLAVIWTFLAMSLYMLFFGYLTFKLVQSMDSLSPEKLEVANSFITWIAVVGVSKFLFDLMVGIVLACYYFKLRNEKKASEDEAIEREPKCEIMDLLPGTSAIPQAFTENKFEL